MPLRTRAIDRGRRHGKRQLEDACRQIEAARVDRGLSYAELGRAVGRSGQHLGRVCRGAAPTVDVIQLAELAAVVGLDLVLRTYAGGMPIRDRAHSALLGRLRKRLSPSLVWRTEVPIVDVPGSADQRAWDATIAGPGWIVGVEAETHVTDMQALERRVALKTRDSGVGLVILLLNDTAHHQQLLASVAPLPAFPASARSTLRALGMGQAPSGSAVVSL